MASNESDRRIIKTTELSLEIVQTIQEHEGLSFMDLKSKLEVAKSTLHYHLNTLQKHGYVIKNDQTYQIGLRFLTHAEYAKRQEPGFEKLRRKSAELADMLPEEIDFSVEENGRLIVVYHNIGGEVTSDFEIGQYLYLHSTAAGKVILAAMSNTRVENIIERWGLPQVTDKTITDKSTLFEELENTKQRGFGINNEEEIPGLRSVSVPIHKPDGTVLGALSATGPTYRLTLNRIKENVSDDLLDAAAEIESELESLP